jgi:hypothetical protein
MSWSSLSPDFTVVPALAFDIEAFVGRVRSENALSVGLITLAPHTNL